MNGRDCVMHFPCPTCPFPCPVGHSVSVEENLKTVTADYWNKRRAASAFRSRAPQRPHLEISNSFSQHLLLLLLLLLLFSRNNWIFMRNLLVSWRRRGNAWRRSRPLVGHFGISTVFVRFDRIGVVIFNWIVMVAWLYGFFFSSIFS